MQQLLLQHLKLRAPRIHLLFLRLQLCLRRVECLLQRFNLLLQARCCGVGVGGGGKRGVGDGCEGGRDLHRASSVNPYFLHAAIPSGPMR